MGADGIGPRLIVIDGYNMIRRTPRLAAAERNSLEAGRAALIALVTQRYRCTPHHVMIVFDGDGDDETTQAIPRLPRGRVIYSARGVSADSVIQRFTTEQGPGDPPAIVVSDDMGVRADATGAGASAASVEALSRRLDEPDKYRRRQETHRAFLRDQLRRETEDAPRRPRKGNPRKTPRRPRQEPTRDLP
ncbi:MAG TPA: NYN domain-containing protein [Ktedonobacterales bacterium]|nr:NYN domain-containing protein [Ktedonobacterales bacterium]